MDRSTTQPGDRHGSGYMMGHSASEAERLDQQHVFFRHVVDEHLLSPLLDQSIRSGKIRRVLDIGTGTGIWCFDAAAELQAMNLQGPIELVGVDIAESEHWKKHSVYPAGAQPGKDAFATISLQVADLNDDVAMSKLADEHGQFDLINSRMMISAVKQGKWEAYLERIFKLLRPGGYVQLFEADMINSHAGRLNDPTVSEALVITHAVYSGMGLDPETAVKLTVWLYQGGFVHVRDTAQWCNPITRQADGSLKIDKIIHQWHATAYQVLQPIFLKLRASLEYARFLEKLPQHALQCLGDDQPVKLLANEAEYRDFLSRHDAVLNQNPLYRTVFRAVLAQRPE